MSKPRRKPARAPSAQARNAKQSAQTIQLAQNGKALLPIVIAARASEETKRTAGELAGYLKRIAGADFVVQLPNGKSADLTPTPRTISVEQAQMKLAAGEAGLIKANAAVQAPGGENDEILVKQAKVAKIVLNLARKNLSASQAAEKQEVARLAAPPEMLPSSGIAVGMREEYSVPELQTPLAIHNDIDGREAFAIRAQPKRLLLISATERGVHHAAYRLLEALGCRWLATGEHWEIIPSTPDLSFGMDITDRPTIPTRVIAFMDGAMSDEMINGKKYSERTDMANWMRRI